MPGSRLTLGGSSVLGHGALGEMYKEEVKVPSKPSSGRKKKGAGRPLAVLGGPASP